MLKCSSLALLLALALLGSTADAAVYTWNTTSGDWGTTTNWSPNGTPGATADTINFLGNSAQSLYLGADRGSSTTNITLSVSNTGTTTLYGGTVAASGTNILYSNGITLNAGAGALTIGDATRKVNLQMNSTSITNNSSSLLTIVNGLNSYGTGSQTVFTFAGSGSTSVTGSIGNGTGSNSVNVTKSGAGTLSLSGSNSYSAGTTINSGTVIVGNAGGLGTGGVTNNGVLNLTVANVTYTGLSTSLAGSGTVNVANLGTGTNSVALNGLYSSFSGVWNIGVGAAAGAGKAQMNGADSASTRYNVLTNATVFVSTAITKSGTINLAGGDTGESIGQLRLDAGANWAGRVIISGTMSGSGDTTFGTANYGTISGVISDGGQGISMASNVGVAGRIYLTNTNTYTGLTKGVTGSLIASTTAAFPSIAKVTVASGAAVGGELGTGYWTDAQIQNLVQTGTFASGAYVALDTTPGSYVMAGTITNTPNSPNLGIVKTGNNTLTLTGTNTFTGNIAIANGTLSVANTYSMGSGGQLILYNGTTFNPTGSYTISRAVVLNSGIETIDTGGNTLTLTGTISGSGSLTKSGTGTLIVNKTQTSTGQLILNGGTVQYGANQTTLTGATFGAAAASTNISTLDLTNASFTTSQLLVQTNTTAANTVTIGSGKTLTVTGNLTMGSDNAAGLQTQSNLTIGGAGTLAITGTRVQIGVSQGTADGSNNNKATLDLRTLGSFSANVTTFNVGQGNTSQGTLYLSNTANTVLATTLTVGDSNNKNGAGDSYLYLGTGTNVLQSDTINIGRGKGTDPGHLQFVSSTGAGTVVITDKAGTGGANINIADDNGAGTGGGAIGTLDLRGHTATVTADVLTISTLDQTSTGGTSGTLYFDTGTFTVNSLSMAPKSNTGTGTANATLNVGGGTFTVNSGSGNSFYLARQSGSGSSVGTLNITGGVFTSNVNILDGGGTTTSTIMLNGGTLDMNGHNIGDATNPITNLNFQSGTLTDIGTLNGTAGLTKTTTGTLTITGNSGYTGSTTISAGTLVIDGAGQLKSGAYGGAISISSGATFQYNSSASQILSGVISGGGVINKTGSGTLTLAGANTYTGSTTVSAGKVVVAGKLGNNDNSATTVANGATLQLANYSAARTLTGALTLNGGTLQLIDNQGSGGTTTVANNLVTHIFTSSGALTVPGNITGASMLLVGGGGGGGGGASGTVYDAGGGGGQVLNLTGQAIGAGTITVTVGGGGTGRTNANGDAGGDTILGAQTANGGNGAYTQGNGGASGSGKAGGSRAGQSAGGGGGDSAVGLSGSTDNSHPGAGGAGSKNTAITGLTYGELSGGFYYFGGGGGGNGYNAHAAGGLGGGGDGNVAGIANSGGGGGGSMSGGSGIAVVQYVYASSTVNVNGAVTLGATSTLDPYKDLGLIIVNGNISESAAGSGLNINSSGGAGGEVVLAGTNSYTGATTVNNNATLKAGNAYAFTGNGSLVVNSGGTFDLNGYDVTFTGASGAGAYTNSGTSVKTMTVTGAPSISGAVTGNLALKVDASTSVQNFTLSGSLNTFNGGILIRSDSGATGGARLFIQTGGTYGTGAITIGESGGDTSQKGQIVFVSNSLNLTNNVVINATGGLDHLTGNIRNNGTGNTMSGTITANKDLIVSNYSASPASADLTITGKIIGAGGLQLNRGDSTGGSTLILAGSNSYTGGTTITAGVLRFVSGGLGATGNVTMNGGTLQWASGNTQDVSSRLVMVNSTTATFDTNSNNVTLASGFGGGTSGALVKTGAGVLTLGGTCDYTGGTTVLQGSLIGMTAASIPGTATPGAIVVSSGASLGGRIGGSGWSETDLNNLISNVTWNTGSYLGIDTTNGNYVYSGSIGGSMGVTKVGSNTLTLGNSANDYTGGTQINAGTLSFVDGALGTTGNITMNGGTLQWASGNTQDISARLIMANSTTTTLDTNGNNVTLATGLGGGTSGALTKTGAGTLTLAGNGTYSGITTVTGGTLAVTGSSATTRYAISSGTNSTVLLTNVGAVAELVAATGAANPIFQLHIDGGTDGTIALPTAAIGANSGLAVTLDVNNYTGSGSNNQIQLNGTSSIGMGSSTVNVTGGNGYSLYIANIRGSAGGAPGNGTITFNPTTASLTLGTLTSTHTNPTKTDIWVFGGTDTASAVTGSILNGNGGTGAVASVVKSNVGTWTFSGSNAYTGATTITGGTLKVGNAYALASSGSVNVTGATLDVAGYTAGINELGGTGTIDNSTGSGVLTVNAASSDTFGGTIMNSGGSLALVKSGAGTLSLGGNNSYSGGTTINGGVLQAASNTALGTGEVTTAGTSCLQLSGVTISNPITLSATGGYFNASQIEATGGVASQLTGLVTLGTTSKIAISGSSQGDPNGNNTTLRISGGVTSSNNSMLNLYADATNSSITVDTNPITIGNGTLRGHNVNLNVTGNTVGTLMVDYGGTWTMGVDEAFTIAPALNVGNTYSSASQNILDLNGHTQTFSSIVALSNTTTYTHDIITSGVAGGNLIASMASSSTYAGVITGSLALTKTGAGTFTLSGSNTYTGGTTISGGTIAMGNNRAFGAQGSTVTIQNGGALDTRGYMFSGSGASAMNYALVVSGSGPTGNGALLNSVGDQMYSFNNITMTGDLLQNNTFRQDLRSTTSVTLDMNGFTWTKTGTGATSMPNIQISNPGNFVINQGQMSVEGSSPNLGGSADNSFTVNSGAGLYFYNMTTVPVWTINLNGGALQNYSGTPTWAGPVNLQGLGVSNTFDTRYNSAAGATMTLSNTVSGNGFTKINANALVLTGSNNYTGQTYVIGGAVRAVDGVGLPTTSNLSLNGGTFEMLNGGVFGRNLGTNPGEVQIAGAGGFGTYGASGTVSLNGGADLTWGQTGLTPAALTLNGATANNVLSFQNNLDLNNTSAVLSRTFFVNSNTAVIAGTLSNSGSAANLVFAGSSILVLAGNNTYTGQTVVAAGSLRGVDGAGLPTASNLSLTGGVYEINGGVFTRTLGSGSGQVQISGSAGLSTYGASGTVNFGGAGSQITWGGAGFTPTQLILNASTATAPMYWTNGINLNNAGTVVSRTFVTNANQSVIGGVLTNSSGTANAIFAGSGTTVLTAANSYNGDTTLLPGYLMLANTTGAALYNGVATPGRLIISDSSTKTGNAFVCFGAANQLGSNVNVVFRSNTGGYAYMKLLGNSQTVGSISADYNPARAVIENMESDTVNTDATLTINQNTDVTYNGYMRNRSGGTGTGRLAIVKSGTGKLTFSGTNIIYTGTTTIQQGTIALNGANAFASTVFFDTGSTGSLELATDSKVVGLSSNGTVGTVQAAALGGGTTVVLTVNQSGTTTYGGLLRDNADTTALALTKTGAGTLTLAGNNTYSGGTTLAGGTVLVSSGSALGIGTVTLGGGMLGTDGTPRTIGNNIVLAGAGKLGNTGNTSLLTVNSQMVLNAPGTINVLSDVSITGGVFGGYALTKTGAGTLYLSSAAQNQWNGGTTITQGFIALDNTAAAGQHSAANMVLTNGGLMLNFTGVQDFLTAAINGAGSTNGVIAINAASATENIDFSAAGLATGYLGAISGNVVDYTGTFTPGTAGAYLLGGGGGTLNFTPTIAGNSTVTIGGNGGGIVQFSGSNSYSGGTTIGGVLNVQDSNALGSGAVAITGANVSQLQLQGGVTVSNDISLLGTNSTFAAILNVSGTNNVAGLFTNSGGGGILFQSDAGLLLLGGTISTGSHSIGFAGAGDITMSNAATYYDLTKTGAGTLTLGGNNNFTHGLVSLQGGTLKINDADALTASTTIAISDGATLDLNGFSQSIKNLTGATGTPVIDNSSADAVTLTINNTASGTFAGVIRNSGGGALGLTKLGNVNLTLSGSNSFTGPVFMNGSGNLLTVSNANALGNTSGVTISTTGTQQANLTLAGVTVSGISLELNASATGNGARSGLLASGTGGTWAGPITISGSNGAAQFNTNGAPLTIAGNIIGTNDGTNTMFFRGASGLGNINGTINAPNAAFFKTDAGTWYINSTDNNWGATGVATGTLKLGVDNALPTTTALTVNQSGAASGAIFDLNGHNQMVASIGDIYGNTPGQITSSTGTGTLTVNNSSSMNYGANGGRLTGSLALTKTGAGILNLTGNNTYTGSTNILAGTLIAGHNNALGGGNVVISDGTLEISSGINPANTVLMTSPAATYRKIFGDGSQLANYANTSELTGGINTTLSLSGTSSLSGGAIVFNTWRAPIAGEASFGLNLISNVTELTGCDGNLFVIQMSYDPDAISTGISGHDSVAWLLAHQGLYVGTLDSSDTWVNAITLDHGANVGSYLGNHAFNAATDMVLGNWGVDVANNIAWAVIDHNSGFAVVPEPGTMALLLVGGIGVLLRRRRK